MKKIVFILLILSAIAALGQSKHVNTKKGLAAKGYDVVAYFDGNAAEGNKVFSTNYEGVEYRFSTLGNKERFEKEPTKFLPAYGGYCAYAVAVSGKKVNINPETFEIREGKLYLFYNSGNTNTLELWLQESPDELRSKADKNWQTIVER
ncbi:hypothetical protein M3P19_13955 [Muricauda sp. 2012CJ35-5]|uniref:YHS domain-containing protein n=1 Tax=Flagellimonas spongiicola TaxID=2942208 RepID=A0ABT0PUS1_9FLAO|nr:YHS domain-containing (seleno)protein [Allomuricauda spongiicola]MCL6275119.1 hypothetical protein [Allomuricauda spongiicola]